MLILVILGYTCLVFYEFVPLYKKKLWWDFWTNTVLGILSFTFAVLLSLAIKIPSPEKPIREFITMIFGK
jgi:hypothetical protein